jgi:hypothetical protein
MVCNVLLSVRECPAASLGTVRPSCVMLGDYPLLAVHVHDVVIDNFLDVHEGKGCEARKHEQGTDLCLLRVCEFMRHYHFQLVLRQKLTLLDIRTDMELRKRISRYQPVEVSAYHHSFQPHTIRPNTPVL